MAPHSSLEQWQSVAALVIGRAYPEPSRKHIETVCTGIITEAGELRRLYPISWRYLDEIQQYRLWTWANFEITKSLGDKRKESFRVREETITPISQVESAAEQFSLLKPALFQDRETLDVAYHDDWTSLGLVEIEMVDLDVRETSDSKRKEKSYTRQTHLYVEVKPLEIPPVEVRLRCRCKNNPNCSGHSSRLIGWEYIEAFRKFRARYGSGAEAVTKLKEGIAGKFSNSHNSAYALFGTHSRYPVWMIGQLYFFEKDMPSTLF